MEVMEPTVTVRHNYYLTQKLPGFAKVHMVINAKGGEVHKGAEAAGSH